MYFQEARQNFFDYLKSKPKAFHLTLSCFLVLVIGIADSVTGPEITLSVFYLIPIFLTAFYVGLKPGIFVSIACIISYLIADRIVAISYSKAATPYWNSAARLLLFIVVAYFLAKRKMAEQKLSESEERFRLLVEGVRDHAIIMLDLQGKIVSWNTSAERAFGYQSQEILGKEFFRFFPLTKRESKLENILQIASGQEVANYEGWCIRKNKSRFWGDIVITALRDSKEHLRGFSMLTRDTTERRKAEETVRVYAELHQIDRAILKAESSEHLAQEALLRIKKLIPFYRATISLVDMDLNEATILAMRSEEKLDFQSGEMFLLEPEISKDFEMLKVGKVLIFEDANSLEASSLFGKIHSNGIDCAYFVPLLSSGKLIGALYLGMKDQNNLTEEQLKIAREVADQVAVALHNSLLYEQVRDAHLQMQTLSHCLIQIQESERRHLARELHDEMGQALTAVKIHLQEIEGVSNNTAVLNDVHESIAIVEKILNQVRSLSIDLRPLLLDDLGLVATLRWYVSRQSQLGGFTIHFAASPEKMNLSGDLETACFRIVQEAITNIIRHSQAKKVHVEITQLHEELSLLVRDDGIGFDVEAAQKRSSQGLSMGLLGMRERVALLAGQMEIESVSTYGTEIRVRFPIPAVIGTIA
jgi:PAS domain S-box-containing protein